MRSLFAILAVVASVGAFGGPPARALRPAGARDTLSQPSLRQPTRRAYEGEGKRPQEVGDLPENTPVLVLGPPLAFLAIIAIASQFVHLK